MPKDWLKLHYINSLSPALKRALVIFFGSPAELFAASRQSLHDAEILSETGITALLGAKDNLSRSDLSVLESVNSQYIGFNDPLFPDLLNEIPSPPLGLFARGNVNLLRQPQIAIVGSRNASPSGIKTTQAFAAELTAMGFTITSGMAAGIDTHAHIGSLSAGNSTIAVMGTGIDRIYPNSNQKLYQEIAENGLVITEFPPGSPPRRANFPERNRIISGLSFGTLVVEAGIRSGSLITARLAAEQGRDVFAIPGSIHQPTSRGCHYLIRQGAKLVESVSDIIDEIDHFLAHDSLVSQINPGRPCSKTEHPVYNLIDYAPIAMDEIIELSGLTTAQVSSILINLELRGLIADSNGYYQRLPEI